MKNTEMTNNTEKNVLSNKFDFAMIKDLNKKNELDNVDDLWYFVKSSKNRWIIGSAH